MRQETKLDESTYVIQGHDHAVGRFVQICNDHYAKSKHDLQGEGYVFDWDEMFGVSLNLIEIDDLDLMQLQAGKLHGGRVTYLVHEFLKKLSKNNL